LLKRHGKLPAKLVLKEPGVTKTAIDAERHDQSDEAQAAQVI
jgi:hypothetical protein